MNDIKKMVKSFEVSGLLIKGVSERIKNKAKEERSGFLRMLLGEMCSGGYWYSFMQTKTIQRLFRYSAKKRWSAPYAYKNK